MKPDLEVVQIGRGQSFKAWEHGYPFHTVRWHFHPELEIHQVVATSGRYYIGDFIGEFEPGNLVLTGPNLPHNWVSNIPPEEHVADRDMLVQFTPDFAERVAGFCPELGAVRQLFDEAVHGVEFTGATAEAGRSLLAEIGRVRGAERIYLFLRLMERLSRDPADRRRLSRLAPAGRAELPPALDAALHYMNESHAEDLELAGVAARAGLSPQSFSRLFKRQTGHTFASYLVLVRVYAACSLLTQTHRPVTDICFEVGFNTIANFNRQFLKICGRTPSDYRRMAHRIGSDTMPHVRNTATIPPDTGGKG